MSIDSLRPTVHRQNKKMLEATHVDFRFSLFFSHNRTVRTIKKARMIFGRQRVFRRTGRCRPYFMTFVVKY